MIDVLDVVARFVGYGVIGILLFLGMLLLWWCLEHRLGRWKRGDR